MTNNLPVRKYPGRGVIRPSLESGKMVFLTACISQRKHLLANQQVHTTLRAIWSFQALRWRVSRYVLMPDHLHLFCSPEEFDDYDIEAWVKFWKSEATRQLAWKPGLWQKGCFHHRIRSDESFTAKWTYVEQNPVRAGLVRESKDWPFQGYIWRDGELTNKETEFL
jgi:putative transposase